MAKIKNPAHDHRELSAFSQGVVHVQPFVVDLSADYAAAAANGDLIQIGVVPADCVLVEHLTRVRTPAIDSNGAPTGEFQIGTEDDPDALLGTQQAETAATFFGEDWTVQTTPIGSQTEPTPIYLTVTAALATFAATGTIRCDLAFRAFNSDVDG